MEPYQYIKLLQEHFTILLIIFLLLISAACQRDTHQRKSVNNTQTEPPQITQKSQPPVVHQPPPQPIVETEDEVITTPPKPNEEVIEDVQLELDVEVAHEEIVFESVPQEKFNTEEYDHINENDFKDVLQNPLSTFSIDVDKASYANMRRFINNNELPPSAAVRIEELVNYFQYDYPQPDDTHPFSITTETTYTPWNADHQLLKIGIKGENHQSDDLPSSNLVFLIDVSGSMDYDNKLPLAQKSLNILTRNLTEKDRVAIVVYAGAAGVVLPSTNGADKTRIKQAINELYAGGSTAGGAGIVLAYKIAKENFIENGNNRVILSTDGDFNIGVSSTSELVNMIEEKRKDGIYLTICGYGMGNYKDGRMEQITNAGNGNYFYIDNILEAKKVYGTELRSNLFSIAKDVKIQIEFNPSHVAAYRLIGYENRLMENEDFADDKKDAGELGAGHTVTALYELVLKGSASSHKKHAPLKYQETKVISSKELATIKFRYKPLDENESILIEKTIDQEVVAFDAGSENTRFATSVAAFGMMLRNSAYKGNMDFETIREIAKDAQGEDPYGYRHEFITLIEKAELINANQ